MMTEGTGLLFAIGLSMLLFGGLLVLFGEQNPLFKYLFVMGILVSGFFIPTAVYQLRTACTIDVNMTSLSANTTTYTYGEYCYTTNSNAPDTFYKIMWSLYQILIVYIIVRIIVLMFGPLWARMRR